MNTPRIVRPSKFLPTTDEGRTVRYNRRAIRYHPPYELNYRSCLSNSIIDCYDFVERCAFRVLVRTNKYIYTIHEDVTVDRIGNEWVNEYNLLSLAFTFRRGHKSQSIRPFSFCIDDGLSRASSVGK